MSTELQRPIEFYPHSEVAIIVQYNHPERICITQYSDDWEEDLTYDKIVAVSRVFSKFEIVEPKKIDK